MSKKGPIRKKEIEQKLNPKLDRYSKFNIEQKKTENDDDDDIFELQNEIQSMKENAFKIDPKLKQKSKILIKEEPIEKMVVEWNCVKNNELDFNLIEKVFNYMFRFN
jgi:hypothetical protein